MSQIGEVWAVSDEQSRPAFCEFWVPSNAAMSRSLAPVSGELFWQPRSSSAIVVLPHFHTRRSGPKKYPNLSEVLALDAKLKVVTGIGKVKAKAKKQRL